MSIRPSRRPADLTSSIDAVVVGLDREFTYAKLFRANAAIRGGARYVATNTDATLPTEQGLVPGCGSILAAVTASVGIEPEVVGKPETLMFAMACADMGISAGDCAAIGDRLDTDIVAANRFGAISVMVLNRRFYPGGYRQCFRTTRSGLYRSSGHADRSCRRSLTPNTVNRRSNRGKSPK